jgi:hypothetical protein
MIMMNFEKFRRKNYVLFGQMQPKNEKKYRMNQFGAVLLEHGEQLR